jgi:hypothetical protein
MNYMEVLYVCFHISTLGNFLNANFLQDIDLLGHLRLILLPLKSLDHIHIIYSIIGHFRTQKSTEDDPAFYQL